MSLFPGPFSLLKTLIRLIEERDGTLQWLLYNEGWGENPRGDYKDRGYRDEKEGWKRGGMQGWVEKLTGVGRNQSLDSFSLFNTGFGAGLCPSPPLSRSDCRCTEDVTEEDCMRWSIRKRATVSIKQLTHVTFVSERTEGSRQEILWDHHHVKDSLLDEKNNLSNHWASLHCSTKLHPGDSKSVYVHHTTDGTW